MSGQIILIFIFSVVVLLFLAVKFRKSLFVDSFVFVSRFFHSRRSQLIVCGNSATNLSDENFKAVVDDYSDLEGNDCDVTYKTGYNVFENSSFRKLDVASASNDDKNMPKYRPTQLQDVSPTDLA